MYYLNTLVNSCIQNRRKMTLTVCPLRSFERFLREGFNKKNKKNMDLSIFGWVGWFRMGTISMKKTRKKHAFKIHFRPF